MITKKSIFQEIKNELMTQLEIPAPTPDGKPITFFRYYMFYIAGYLSVIGLLYSILILFTNSTVWSLSLSTLLSTVLLLIILLRNIIF